ANKNSRGGKLKQQESLSNPPEFTPLQHELPFYEGGYPILP
ncbi:20503_t:CDS:1, partial [Racocetra persica]